MIKSVFISLNNDQLKWMYKIHMVWLIIVELKLNYKIIIHLLWKKSTRMEWRIKWIIKNFDGDTHKQQV